jgi:hypothetical protein
MKDIDRSTGPDGFTLKGFPIESSFSSLYMDGFNREYWSMASFEPERSRTNLVICDGGMAVGGVEEQPCNRNKNGEETNTSTEVLKPNLLFMWAIMYATTDK